MIAETPPLETADGLAPQAPGWYVVDARDARWVGQRDTSVASEAYADVADTRVLRYRDGDLPG